MRRKTIKKPKFIKIFCLWLAVLWVITGACSFFMYRLTDSKLEKMYEEEMDGYIATLEGLCNNYYEACETYAWDEYEHDKVYGYIYQVSGTRSELLYNMDLVAANTGIYSELHVDKELLESFVKKRYEWGDIRKSEMDIKLQQLQEAEVEYASSEFKDGVVAFYRSPFFLPNYNYRSSIPISDISFSCDGETMKIGPKNELDAEDREIKDQMRRIKEVNDAFGVPIWNYLNMAYNPDCIKGEVFNTYTLKIYAIVTIWFSLCHLLCMITMILRKYGSATLVNVT